MHRRMGWGTGEGTGGKRTFQTEWGWKVGSRPSCLKGLDKAAGQERLTSRGCRRRLPTHPGQSRDTAWQ